MVLVEQAGGVRERQIFLYFWDERDGADWSGWWITPDFMGNNEYFLHADEDCDAPADLPVGSWHSPLVEMQLKRALNLGFEQHGDVLVPCGGDVDTPMSPDHMCKLLFSKFQFRPKGLHHGRLFYEAEARDPPKNQVKNTAEERDANAQMRQSLPFMHPGWYVALGVGVGVLAASGAVILAKVIGGRK